MANIPFDPLPFVSNDFNIFNVEGRNGVARVVLPHRQKSHEDWAIVTIEPLPDEVLFPNVQEVLDEFFADVQQVQIREMQRCPLGRHMCIL